MDKQKHVKSGTKLYLDEVQKLTNQFGHEQPSLHHYLFVLLERHGAMAESLVSGLNAGSYQQQIEQMLRKGDVGEHLEAEVLLEDGLNQAKKVGRDAVSERDVAAVLLVKAGWTLIIEREPAENVKKSDSIPGKFEGEHEDKKQTQFEYRPRSRYPTPMLEQYGRDLCQEAITGNLPTVLGRDVELQGVMETLCRWTKRNPLLIGPAGVGKTTIVEALAQKIVVDDVPHPLSRTRLFSLQTSTLIRGASIAGEMEKRVDALLNEASQDGIILFIDEIHTIVGAGGVRQLSDLASLMKSALARGEIACIGATTEVEYHTFINHDQTLERRFQPVRIQELATDATLEILDSLCQRASRENNISFSDKALRLILQLAQQYLRNRYFPDKAIDIFEQCVAYALINDTIEVTQQIVQSVVERMTGVPVALNKDLGKHLGTVKERLITEAFCPEEISDRIVGQLEITMRGLDVSPIRPNVILLTVAEREGVAELTAQVLAEALYGSQDRLIELDMTRFSLPADVTWLTGAPPGYVGHESALPFLLELSQKPWSVLHVKNVAKGHYLADEILSQAFRDGYFTDAQGRRIYLSDATVVLSANRSTKSKEPERPLGFDLGEEPNISSDQQAENKPEYARVVGSSLWKEIDIDWAIEKPTKEQISVWVERRILPSIDERYRQQGLEIKWDPSILKLVTDHVVNTDDLFQSKRMIEEQVLPLLIPHLGVLEKVLLLSDESGSIHIKSVEGD